MLVTGIKCKLCGDIIYSRALHDQRYCSCGNCMIDGGFDYCRMGWGYRNTNMHISQQPETIAVEVKADKFELWSDWDLRKNKFGLIKTENKK